MYIQYLHYRWIINYFITPVIPYMQVNVINLLVNEQQVYIKHVLREAIAHDL
jgi:hypothetical protein